MLEECYTKMQKECGIEVGDKVKVLRKAESYELGWGTIWDGEMDSFVGNEYVVDRISDTGGILVKKEHSTVSFFCWFPFFVLEVVKKKKDEIDLSDYETVIKLHKEMWDWLAEESVSSRKNEWPGFDRYGIDKEEVHRHCFLCEYVKRKVGPVSCFECEKNCPGKWGNYRLIHGNTGSICQEGEFGFYEKRGNFSEEILKRVYTKIRDICD